MAYLLNPGLLKFALTAHITSSVGWLGAVVGFLAHAIVSVSVQETETVRAAYQMMQITGWFVLLPLSLASLITGIIQSLGTKWGLFRHHWVLTKFLLTVFATIILLTFLSGFAQLADVAVQGGVASSHGGGHGGAASPIVHAAGGLIVLLTCVVLSVYKPWGKTAYGRRQDL